MVKSQGIYTPLSQHLRCGKIRLMKKLKMWQKMKREHSRGENPRANGLARRNVSCSDPAPYACMSASVSLMVGGWMVFSVVISQILGASIPTVMEMVLRGPAVKPPKAHIPHLVPMRGNSVVNDPCSSGVVSLDGAPGLGPSHVNEDLPVGNHFSCCDEEGSQFRNGHRWWSILEGT